MPLTLIITLYQQLPLNSGTNVAGSVGTQLCSSLVMIDFLRVLSSQISLAKAARITVLERRKYGRSTWRDGKKEEESETMIHSICAKSSLHPLIGAPLAWVWRVPFQMVVHKVINFLKIWNSTFREKSVSPRVPSRLSLSRPPKKVSKTENFTKLLDIVQGWQKYIQSHAVVLGEAKSSYVYTILKPHHLLRVRPKYLSAIAHLGCTRKYSPS